MYDDSYDNLTKIERLRAWWKKNKKPLEIIAVAIFLVGLIVLIILGYIYNWAWAGLGPNAPSFKSGKTLWDWLGLIAALAIPVVVGFGVAWFTMQQGKVSDAENKDNQQEAALQAYIDKISELLLHEKLRDSADDKEVRNIARVQTLTVLPRLGKDRKKSVLQFLYESGLIKKDKCIIDLRGADLSKADLSGANLANTNLNGADLSGVNLSRARLEGANLYGANLTNAILGINMDKVRNDKEVMTLYSIRDPFGAAFLSGFSESEANYSNVDLHNANLCGSLLTEADLRGVNFYKANLHHAFLVKANLQQANLEEASLIGAILVETNLRRAKLCKADLREAILLGADLRGADLSGTNLANAGLSGANLSLANLMDVDLSGADLSRANLKRAISITTEQLNEAKSLQGATMPDGSVHS